MEKNEKIRRKVGKWRAATVCMTVLSIGLLIAVIVLAMRKEKSHTGLPTCGESTGVDGVHYDHQIDLTEPEEPGPFHDLTRQEIQKLRNFLENDPSINAVKAEETKVNSTMIFTMDLLLPKKSDLLRHLDDKDKPPSRHARVIVFQGDANPPVVREYKCGPLPKITRCSSITSEKRRNPVEFAVRPFSLTEIIAYAEVLTKIDKEIGYILKESYGTTFTNCKPKECFKFLPSPLGTKLVGDINKRLLWVWPQYPVEHYNLHPTGFGILLDISGCDPSAFTFTNVWYNGQLYENTDELIRKYNSSSDIRVKIHRHKNSKDFHSALYLRGDPLPEKPQRPPTVVEPDGKRYTLKDRKVEYLGWSFNFRMSTLTGPSLYNIKYKKERIAYELGLSEIAVTYSANNPMHRITDFVDSGVLLGSHSKSLVPGGDCPESATFINQTFSSELLSDAVEYKRAFCLFENNNGYPLRRHLSYSTDEGGFYNGMLDSVLVLRSILTVVNYDYVIDFTFHQNGVIQTTVMSTGYIYPSFYRSEEKPYGFHIDTGILGNIHHHMFHFKADLDIGGTSNSYETLDIKSEEVRLRVEPGNKYYQTKFQYNLRKSEKEALYSFNFDEPKYHVVHNNSTRTQFGEIKAYRIGLQGMSKQLLPKDVGNERTSSWARYQLVVTKHKDDEGISSSPYAMWDSYNPVTDFTAFYDDDERIVNEDLVFWISQGMHHIPHTEDLPVTPTVGNHLTFFLFPYNYFDECPSMASRDQIRIEQEDHSEPSKGLKIDRNGNADEQCAIPQTASAYDQLIRDDPDTVIESKKFRGLI